MFLVLCQLIRGLATKYTPGQNFSLPFVVYFGNVLVSAGGLSLFDVFFSGLDKSSLPFSNQPAPVDHIETMNNK
jgi:hypothetical protein